MLGLNINYYYLCADLHQYQIGNIVISPRDTTSIDEKMIIKQYTVGTGGADQDPFPFKKPHDIREIKRSNILFTSNGINYDVEYLMTPEELELSGSMYGFLQCSSGEDDTKLSFKFIDVDGDRYVENNPREGLLLLSNKTGGKRNKTKKIHKKYNYKKKFNTKKRKNSITYKKDKHKKAKRNLNKKPIKKSKKQNRYKIK